MNNQNLTVFIPCFNEEKNIATLIDSWSKAVSNYENISVLFINNGSTDKTSNFIQKHIESTDSKNLDFFDIEVNRGYGYGILEGINYDNSEHICWTHADLQFGAEEVVKIINKYLNDQNKCQVYKGQRNSRFILDTIFTRFMSLIGSLTKGSYISDINAQPKIFSRKLFNSISKWPIDFSIDAHLLYESKKINMKSSVPDSTMPRIHENAKGGGTIKGKIKLSLLTLKYLLGFYEKY